jgi:hypothetical protein
MAAVSLVPIVLKAVLMVPASVVIAAVAPKPIIAATSAYSMRSWPDSSFRKAGEYLFEVFHWNFFLDQPPRGLVETALFSEETAMLAPGEYVPILDPMSRKVNYPYGLRFAVATVFRLSRGIRSEGHHAGRSGTSPDSSTAGVHTVC